MIKIFYKNIKNNQVLSLTKPRKGCWIYVEAPSHAELEELAERNNLDIDLLHDGIDPDEAPRIETEDSIVYFFTKYLTTRNNKIMNMTMLVVVADEFILTLVNSADNPVSDFVNSKATYNTTQKTKFMLQIFLRIHQRFKTHIHRISKETNNLGSNIENIGNKEVVRFAELERILNEFLTALIPTKLVFERLLYEKKLRLYEDDEDMVEDLSLSNGQLIEIAKSTLKYITNLRESYSTITANNLNKTMKVLTSITVILTIPTMIASFFGMNVFIPGQETKFAFEAILVGTGIVALLLLFLFHKKELL